MGSLTLISPGVKRPISGTLVATLFRNIAFYLGAAVLSLLALRLLLLRGASSVLQLVPAALVHNLFLAAIHSP